MLWSMKGENSDVDLFQAEALQNCDWFTSLIFFPEVTMTGNVLDWDYFVTFGPGVNEMAQNYSRPTLDL